MRSFARRAHQEERNNVCPTCLVTPVLTASCYAAEDAGLVAALTKISAHIGNPKKFGKAAPLLRQLFAEGKLSGAHGDLAFEAGSYPTPRGA